MMMIANLIGYCVGLDGIVDLLKGILGSYQGTRPVCPRIVISFLLADTG
jgi:hypothetical protein